MIDFNETKLDEQDYNEAFTEVSFLFEVLSRTVKDVIGNSAPLGVSAGRSMARKLPVNLKQPTTDKVMEVVQKHFEQGLAFEAKGDENSQNMQVGHCMIRDICKNQNQEPGGEMCKIFHSYLGGMVAQLSNRQARVTHSEAGTSCQLEVKLR